MLLYRSPGLKRWKRKISSAALPSPCMLVISGRFEIKNEIFSDKFFTGDNHETHRFLDMQRSDFRYCFICLSLVYIAVN